MKDKDYDRVFVLNDPVNAVDPWGLQAGFPDDFFGWGNPTAFGIPESWESEIADEAIILIEEMARYGKCVAICELQQALGEAATSVAAGQAEARLAVRAAAKAAAIAGKASTVYTMYGVIKCAVDCCKD